MLYYSTGGKQDVISYYLQSQNDVDSGGTENHFVPAVQAMAVHCNHGI